MWNLLNGGVDLGEKTLFYTAIWETSMNRDGNNLVQVEAKASRVAVCIWDHEPHKLY